MNCTKAGEFMMRYMDNILTNEEAENLGKHLNNCPSCKEDFLVYDAIMSDFLELEIVNAPTDFEVEVMEKISALPKLYNKYNIENIMCMVWGSFSVLFGIGFLSSIYREHIFAYFYSNPELSGYASLMGEVSNYVTRFSTNFVNLLNSSAGTLMSYLSSSRYILLLVFAVLAIVQYIIFRKSKVET